MMECGGGGMKIDEEDEEDADRKRGKRSL